MIKTLNKGKGLDEKKCNIHPLDLLHKYNCVRTGGVGPSMLETRLGALI